jgi:hypothetical protein
MSETTTVEGKEQALAWIRRQLHWERTLADLRAERDERPEETRQAA